MELPVSAVIFVAASALAWAPGNKVIWTVWERVARYAKIDSGESSALSRVTGGLERILYIYGAMTQRYELVAGWLVMKAFFGWIPDKDDNVIWFGGIKRNSSETTLELYNSFLIGNLLSLMLGIAVGALAKLGSDHLIQSLTNWDASTAHLGHLRRD